MKLIFFLFFFMLSASLCSGENVPANNTPSFRILAPQVICKGKKNATDLSLSKITISMQTKNGQKLNYRVQIYFESLGGFKGQQHTLKLWDNIRRLEVKINKKMQDVISQKNQINVNNTELSSGVLYTFRIIGFDSDGKESEPQNFTVNFSDGKIKRTNSDGSIIPDDISFLLVGSEQTYSDIEYRMVAEISFCEPRFDYYIQWNITDIQEKNFNYLNVPGNVLIIPPGILIGGKLYNLKATLKQMNDSKSLIDASIQIKVKKRGYSASIVPFNILIGISRNLELKLAINNPDNSNIKPEITWNCQSLSEDKEQENFIPSTTTLQDVEFFKNGIYNISAIVNYENESITTSATVSVDSDVIALPELKNIPTGAIPAGNKLEIETTIHNLIPNCFAEWNVVNEEGFSYFDPVMIPGGLGNITILDIEGNFLSELVDYANNTFSRDILLKVPARDELSNWSGLGPNTKYKFRLSITCPVPITNEERTKIRPNITSFVDVIITTNQPPVGQPLDISPLNGTALKTVFKFTTGVAIDDEIDYPLKYTFKYQVNGLTITIGAFYENMVANTYLPYSETPIQTMYEVCDSRLACSTQLGPEIIVNAPNITDDQLLNLVNKINNSLIRYEYDEAFTIIQSVALSLKNINDQENFQQFQATTNELINREIDRLKEPKDHYISHSLIINFIKMTKQTITILTDNEEMIIKRLQDLLNDTSENVIIDENETDNSVQSRQKRSILENKRKKRDTSSDMMKLSLELSEVLLNGTNETVILAEKQRLQSSIDKYMVKMCTKQKFTSKSFVSSAVIFELRKINSNQLLKSTIAVPLDSVQRHAYISLNENVNVDLNSKFCVGKIWYPSDYQSGQSNTTEIYKLIVWQLPDPKNNRSLSEVNVIDEANNHGLDVQLPIVKIENDEEFKCQVWENREWSFASCETVLVKDEYVNCKCNSVGYFRLKPTKPEDVKPISNTISTLNLSNQPIMDSTTISTLTTTLPSTTQLSTVTNIPTAITTLTTEVTSLISTTVAVVAQNLTKTMEITTVGITEIPTVATTVVPTVVTIAVPTVAITAIPAVTTTETTTVATTETISDITTQLTTPITIKLTTLNTITTTELAQTETISNQTTEFGSNSSISVEMANYTMKNNRNNSLAYTTSYTLASILILLAIILFAVYFIYRKRKKPNSTLQQQFDIITSEMRNGAPGIRYGRFHDEDTMRGDNVETIFAIR